MSANDRDRNRAAKIGVIEKLTPSDDGHHVMIEAEVDGKMRLLSLDQDQAITTGLLLMCSAVDCQRKLSDDPVSVLLPGLDVGVALSDQGTMILHIVTANQLTLAFQFEIGHLPALKSQLEDAETLLVVEPDGAKWN